MLDTTRGTLFHEILEILQEHEPSYVILENVGNFERHDGGRTWTIVKKSLLKLGYHVRGTEHVKSGGHGLVSPHHLGFPHTRERFYIVASRSHLLIDPFPQVRRGTRTSLASLVQTRRELARLDKEETMLTTQQKDCVNHWNDLLRRLPKDTYLPSFPIWGDEILATYPFKKSTPHVLTAKQLRRHLPNTGQSKAVKKSELLALLPSYARTRQKLFPSWKIKFIEQNRHWFDEIREHISLSWISKLQQFPSSLRKLEWNCQGEERDLWRYVLQFRPSGLRAKRYNSCPALVAMTTTQIPILGPKRRFITRVEGLRLQGFPDHHQLPRTRAAAFQALGNAVHVGVVREIAKNLVEGRPLDLTGFESVNADLLSRTLISPHQHVHVIHEN